MDKQYSYTESNYEFWCEDVTFTLKTEAVDKMGWKQYDTEKSIANSVSVSKYNEGDTLDMMNISIKECVTKPPKHFTDASLLSVMNIMHNRIFILQLVFVL